RHPYTQLLLSAAPDPDTMGHRQAVSGVSAASPYVRGEPPSLINPPTGCRFHPRCPSAMPVCSQRRPVRTDLGNGHWTHCFLYSNGMSAGAGASLQREASIGTRFSTSTNNEQENR
ncbi:MAG TPA: oligopeptide/dipeptide ABC transporter ATP-binding protein, partial [Ktedonobacteraceae bacterium]|nr:oligopeptide/dipeptide ABC transporter ATP-binding protein [Ktedonobacteraceae bacterium]